MSKKKIIKMFLINAIAIAMLLILPKIENAFEINESQKIVYENGSKTLNQLISGEEMRLGARSKIFNNKFIFCIEHGMTLNSGVYKLSDKCVISSTTINVYDRNGKFKKSYSDTQHVEFGKKIAYILSYMDDNTVFRTRKQEDIPYDLPEVDDIQLALWETISRNNSLATEIFGVGDVTGVTVHDGNKLGNTTKWYKVNGNKIYINYTSKKAYTIYDEAIKSSEFSGTATVYIIVSTTNKMQRLILVEKVEKITKPDVTINFNKENFNEKELEKAEIKVAAESNVESINNTSLNTSLTIGTGSIKVKPKENTGEFRIKISEKTPPSGYASFEGSITLTVKYNKDNGNVTSITCDESENKTYIPDSSNSTVTIRNKPKLNLTINKKDSLTGDDLSGAKFSIILTNVKDIDGYFVADADTIKLPKPLETVDGQINLKGIVPKEIGKDIEVTITEVEVPTVDGYYYKKLENPVKIIIETTNGVYKVKSGNASISNNTVTVPIKNQPYIKLSGQVWQDGQIGSKDTTGSYNGIKDQGESGKDGVLVQLYNADENGNKTGNYVEQTKTGTDGKYEFKDIPKTKNGYIIVFSYDGINWQETKSLGSKGTDSDVSEIDRTDFNDKFKTISKDKVTREDKVTSEDKKTSTPLGYDYNSNNKTSTLKTTMDGRNPANEKFKEDDYDSAKDFRMSAQTGIYKNTTSNIDCGLVKKEFDLAIGTDVKSARLEINDRKVTYDYAKIIDGEMEDLDLDRILDNNSSDNNKVSYNFYLYQSDYNYRISDYKTDTEGGIKNKVNPEDSHKNYEGLKELEAYVTYSVILKGQTEYSARVDEFVYYYDSVYKSPKVIKAAGYEAKIDERQRKITFTSTSKEEEFNITDQDYRVEVDIEFEVNKNASGYIELKKDCSNVAEITKYSTNEGGLIDKDSAPDNGITVNNNKAEITQYEDDTDKSKGITISLRNDPRTITGTVFEDTDKNGYLNTDKPVNDVIVQLIQIIKYENDPNYYEYIWQETRSGSGTVKKLSSDGNSIEEQDYRTAPNDGSYQFTGYIPGDYIIRYIYGDGTTYDLTDAVKTYNGQDYKSTVDANYNAPCYNTANYNGQSIARDNEARRLEVMAYSTTIDKEKGKALAEKTTLDKTWMCAETSKINVPIDADDLATEENNTKVSYDNVTNTVSFSNMNFGLALRPKTIISLEKHITGLKITPNGVGVQSIVDANADIEQIIKEDNIKTEGVKQGLATIKSTRGERGFWQVATDVEELAQGAQLEVEYTYVIKNDGEKDYLSNTLVGEYTKNPYNYGTYLASTASSIKNGLKGNTNSYGKYLGKFYYTGDSNGCALVPTRIEANGLEEAINNSLVFDNGDDFAKTNESAVSKTVYDTNGNPTTEDITTVVQSNKESEYLTPNNTDHNKTITLRTVLSSTSGGELGANIPSYIAEITKYSNAAGRRDMLAEPANLSYVHSDDTEMTMANSNQGDEFWGETIIIGKPTGGDKITPIQIAIVTISSIAVLGVGIVLIKKFALKK